MARQEMETASTLYREIVAHDSRHVPAWLRLSTLASLSGRYRESVHAALNAATIEPLPLPMRAHVCERLLQVGESKAALDCFMAADLHRASPGMRAEFAFIMHKLGSLPLATRLADAAFAGGIHTPELQYLRATLHMFSGSTDAAEAGLEACLREAPQLASAHWTLSKLRTWSDNHNHVGRLQQALGGVPPNSASAPYLWFALFKELDDCGRYPEAWTALANGCHARRQGLNYSRSDETALFDALIARCTPGFLSSGVALEPTGPTPIFIVGMPRSGTTLLERILGAHSWVSDSGELHDFPYQMLWACDHQSSQMLDQRIIAQADDVDYAEVGRRYLARTQWRAEGRSLYTDKLPRNFLQLGFIHRALPHARILHMKRDPMDTCFSNLKELFGAAYPHSYDMAEMAGHYRDYQRLMVHWHQAMPGRILDVSYEELVATPERVAKEIFMHCGLPWEPHCLAIESRSKPSATASTVQVREPIHGRNVAQWQRYGHQLEPLRRLLS